MMATGDGAVNGSPRGLAPAGVAVAVLLIGRAVAPQGGESLEWDSYLLLGTLCPLLVLGLAAAARQGGGLARAGGLLEYGLGALALAAALLFLGSMARWLALGAAVAHLAITSVLERDAGLPRAFGRRVGMTVLDLIVIAAAWNAAAGLSLATYFDKVSVQTFVGAHTAATMLVYLAVVLAGLRPRAVSRSRGRMRAAGDAVALTVFALLSFRADALFNFGALYHWGYFVGPAELVRQGGWLLWDVPAQYGFLSTLATALVPATSVWDAFFRLNAMLLLLSAALLFGHLRSLGGGAANLLCALLVTVAAVFLLPGLPGLDGWPWPLVSPSQGPMRFIWWLILMAVVRLAAERRRAGRSRGDLMVTGSVVWLLGSLWSFESAVYCSASWLPAYALMAWRDTQNPGRRLRLATILLAPAALATAALAAITAYYLVRLGHPPDWYAFVEFVLAFRGGFGAEPIDPHGGVWLLFVLFCALAIAFAAAVRHGRIDDLVPLVAAWAGLWAISSYFVGRSVELTVASLAPVWCTAIALVLHTVRGWPDRTTRPWVESTCLAVVALVLSLALGGEELVARKPWLVWGRQAWSIEPRRPVLTPAQLTLFAAVGPNDPVAYCADTLPARRDGQGTGGPPPAWLPVRPYPMFDALSDERRKLYVSRFIARAGLSGWLVQATPPSPFSCPWLVQAVAPTHSARRSFVSGTLRLTWFEMRDGSSGP